MNKHPSSFDLNVDSPEYIFNVLQEIKSSESMVQQLVQEPSAWNDLANRCLDKNVVEYQLLAITIIEDLGFTLCCAGKSEQAVRYLQKAADLKFRDPNNVPKPNDMINHATFLAICLVETGDVEKGLDCFKKHRGCDRSVFSVIEPHGFVRFTKGLFRSGTKYYDFIKKMMLEKMDLIDEWGDNMERAKAFGLLASVCAHQHDPKNAIKYGEKALEITDVPQEQALIRFMLVSLWSSLGSCERQKSACKPIYSSPNPLASFI